MNLNLTPLFKRMGKVAVDSSPAILTAIGVTGAVATAYFAAKGAFQASDIIREAEADKKANLGKGFDEDLDGSLSMEEKFNLTWKCYIPAAGCLVLSATAIICSNRVSDRRTAAVATAYSVVKESYQEYRTKTTEKVGKKKEEEIREEIAKERMDRHPFSAKNALVVATGHGATRCYDLWNDRYFTSDMESLRRAVNDLNQQVINDTYASMTDFYHLLDLPSTGHSDDFGWDTDKLMELDYSGHLHPDGTPCIAIDFKVKPNPRYSQLY